MAPRAAASAVPCALVALAALGPPAWACLLCFTSYSERHRICRIFVGVEGPEVEKCEKAFSAAFEGLLDTEINYDERSHLHDSFTQMTFSLQEIATAQGSYEVAFPYAAEKIQEVIAQLKEVQACIPPCGHQELSRRFRCLGCYSRVCDFPLDCPIQDVTVQRGDQALFSCTVKFQLPKEEIAYSWKFAEGGVRTRDTSYFRDMPRARGYLARIRPVQPTHSGTFSCVIAHDQLPLARLYFFLNVTGPPPRGETELQVAFREVLRWAPREAEGVEPWRPSLGELLAEPEALTLSNLCLIAAAAALASAGVTLLAWMFFRWYFSGN
ncbi:sperm acrosome membrane-associated protein 6 isoform X2 [Eptesicus fuscus]|uniref:sperm acrosome membrane-associated protein 6 isoform X2 n=1 Tax=Eptesicus fuscus TaxID=29078 RepID=UPI0024046596|nr:sperm acrosome membrane-associated protein 6 isoform X2 [Eptesicus fuscus]